LESGGWLTRFRADKGNTPAGADVFRAFLTSALSRCQQCSVDNASTIFFSEPWLGGLPLTIAGPPPPFRHPHTIFSNGGLIVGFPLYLRVRLYLRATVSD